MKHWIKEFVNQIKKPNDHRTSGKHKESLSKSISSNDETMPLLQDVVIDIESNISVVNNIVKINWQENQIEQEKQNISKSSNYGSIG